MKVLEAQLSSSSYRGYRDNRFSAELLVTDDELAEFDIGTEHEIRVGLKVFVGKVKSLTLTRTGIWVASLEGPATWYEV